MIRIVFIGGPFDGEEQEVACDVPEGSYRIFDEGGIHSIYKRYAVFVDGVVVFAYQGEEKTTEIPRQRSKWLDWRPPGER